MDLRELPSLYDPDDPNHLQLIIYRWEDGSDALLQLDHSSGLVLVIVRWRSLPASWIDPVSGMDTFPEFWIQDPAFHQVSVRIGTKFPEELEGKALGLFLDMGIERPNSRTPDLVRTYFGDHRILRFPRLVSQERWDRRYIEAEEALDQTVYEFMGFISWIRLMPGRWQYSNTGGLESVGLSSGITAVINNACYFASTADEAVDLLLANELILPESQKEDWEKEHVERGEFVNPSPEEVDVYRALGTDLPFWWEPDELETWIRQKRLTA